MHDPMVVAFEIRRPWPRRSKSYDAKPGRPRWSFGRMKVEPDSPGDVAAWARKRPVFPWWQPRSYSPFWVLAGRGYYWPAVITVWHVEPGGHDSGEVCKHYERRQDSDGKWHGRLNRSWRWHVWHWHLQVIPLQALRRWALTRCAWCGGRSVKGVPVNCSNQWDGPRDRWWRGELDLYHSDCMSVEVAHRRCLCAEPQFTVDGHGVLRDHGKCLTCGKLRGWHSNPDDADRMLAALPIGSRIPAELRPELEAAWARRRAAKETA